MGSLPGHEPVHAIEDSFSWTDPGPPGVLSRMIAFLHEIDSLLRGDLTRRDDLRVGKVGGTDYGKGAEQEYHSLHQLMKLPDTTQVYPGHDFGVTPSSTIGNERRTNPFLLRESFEEFVELKRHWLEYKQEHGIK